MSSPQQGWPKKPHGIPLDELLETPELPLLELLELLELPPDGRPSPPVEQACKTTIPRSAVRDAFMR